MYIFLIIFLSSIVSLKNYKSLSSDLLRGKSAIIHLYVLNYGFKYCNQLYFEYIKFHFYTTGNFHTTQIILFKFFKKRNYRSRINYVLLFSFHKELIGGTKITTIWRKFIYAIISQVCLQFTILKGPKNTKY